jgi:predicted nuclease of predicted toxin-antitoxin system
LLKLLADENIPKKLVTLLIEYGVNVTRLQDLGLRGVSDEELIEKANELGRIILTRDSDFITPHTLLRVRSGVIHISFQPTKNELRTLAKRIAILLKGFKPKLGLLVIVTREYIEIYQ